MPSYKVKLRFLYSDVVHVEADNEEEAISKALNEDFLPEHEGELTHEATAQPTEKQ